VSEVGPAALPALEAAMGEDAGRVAPRLDRGCRSFAVCGGDRVLAYGWLSAGPEWIGEAGCEIRPGPREAYIWNCVTLPSHRRRGMFGALVRGITEQAQREGFERLWIASVAGTAERVVQALGYTAAARLNVHAVGPMRWIRLEGRRVPPAVLPIRRSGISRQVTRWH
jgi:GNAT superfamily N-acetyltransferase